MKKQITLGVHDPAEDYVSSLAPSSKRFFSNRLGEYAYFLFDEPDFGTFTTLRREAKQAGRKVHSTPSFDPEERPQDGRIYQAFSNLHEPGAKLEWNGYFVKKSCDGCGKQYEEIVEDAQPRLDMSAVTGLGRPMFTTGRGLLISDSFVLELNAPPAPYLRGAKLVDVGEDYFLLRSSVDLGLETWDDSVARCDRCGRLKFSPGFFPLFAKPANAADVDVFFSHQYSPMFPIVSGRLARALQGNAPDEVNLWFTGWYPDDLALARLPPLE